VSPTGLGDIRVVDVSTGISGAHLSTVLAQAGAQVTVYEGPGGHPLRRRSLPGAERQGVLLDHLNSSKTITPVGPEPDWSEVDVLVADPETPWGPVAAVADGNTHLVVVVFSGYGLTGPDAGCPTTDFIAQAESGALLVRGLPTGEPVAMGGDLVDWVAGSYAAPAVAAALHAVRRGGEGDLFDVSLCETALLAGTTFNGLLDDFRGRPERTGPARTVESPSIEPTADGYIGVTTNTPAQFAGFLDAIGRPEIASDTRFSSIAARLANWDDWVDAIHSATTTFTSADLLARCVERRVPAAIVNDGSGVVALDHAVERGCFVPSDDGTFLRPRTAWRLHPFDTSGEPGPVTSGDLPLSGLRVLDLTAWWAGPSSSQVLAAFGAEVIHVEAPGRPDGMRLTGFVLGAHERWFDRSFFFHQINTNKRSLVIDAASPDGKQALLDLVAGCDVLMENFTPRVLESFGLDVDTLAAANPRLVVTRLPAFGLDGPWRDHPGFAQTMEQITGMAWVTGHVDDQPRVPRGPCDPNSGMHGAFATLVALFDVERTGRGCLVESTLFDAALTIAAEPLVEWTANGVVMGRMGNRHPHCVPQGLYRGPEPESWLAVSCPDDASWSALCEVIDELQPWRQLDREGRREVHDDIDAAVGRWASRRPVADSVSALRAAGVPVGRGIDPRDAVSHPQMRHRGFFEDVEVDTVGVMPIPTWPYTSRRIRRWSRTPAPAFAADTDALLQGVGYDDDRIAALYASGVTSRAPAL
jgi:crotonobetainyl-CoA:carnitine CoA-transferase CaiB-like acyl-CoA transferase